MPIIIERPLPLGQTADDPRTWLGGLQSILNYLRSLVLLDFATREARSLNAERATVFVSSPITAAAVITMAGLYPPVVNTTFTTALIAFDATSGSARWKMDGNPPTSAVTAVAGMPIPPLGGTLTIVGALNIRSFQIIGEPAQTLNMSITLFQ